MYFLSFVNIMEPLAYITLIAGNETYAIHDPELIFLMLYITSYKHFLFMYVAENCF